MLDPEVVLTTHSSWGIIAGSLELGKWHGGYLSPCADPYSQHHREIQHIRDSEGAECQEHDHRRAGEPAQLGAGFHVVSLTGPAQPHAGTSLVPLGRARHLGVLWGSSPSSLGPMSIFASKALPESSLPFISGASSQVPAATSLRPGLLLQSASCNLFSRQPEGYF